MANRVIQADHRRGRKQRADSFVYVGIVLRYRKLPDGRDKGKVLWTVKYEMEDEGSNSEELDMRELADALARAYAEGKGGPHRAG